MEPNLEPKPRFLPGFERETKETDHQITDDQNGHTIRETGSGFLPGFEEEQQIRTEKEAIKRRAQEEAEALEKIHDRDDELINGGIEGPDSWQI